MVSDSGFRVWDLGFTSPDVSKVGVGKEKLRKLPSSTAICTYGFGVWGIGFRGQGLGVRGPFQR